MHEDQACTLSKMESLIRKHYFYKEFIYIQSGKLHFPTKYNFYQNEMPIVLHDIKIRSLHATNFDDL